MSVSSQLNVRMNPQLKAEGDAALAHAGFSPSQAVRALWEKAARRGEDLEQVVALLAGKDNKQAHKHAEVDDELIFGWSIVEHSFAAHGLHYSTSIPAVSDEVLRERALLERMRERGLQQ